MKLWKILNGNKTIVGLVLLKIMDEPAIVNLLGDWKSVVSIVVQAICGLSLAHHATKGYLSHKKGD